MNKIDESVRIVNSTTGDVTLREYTTIHDSEIGDECRIYERCSIKKCHISEEVDINAGSYVENAEIGPKVQIGPNSSIVGVTHELGEDGMIFRNDVFERIILHEGVFIGANVVLLPGVDIGKGSVIAAGATVSQDIGSEMIVLGSPPTQQIVTLEDWKSN